MGVDLSVYGNQKTLADYGNARQQMADQAQQLYQQGQAQNLDLLSKKNIYATQVLSAVSASGDQNAYNMGLQHLKQAGIDTSAWAPDVQTGAQQAQQARLAQSPLGSLLNAANGMDRNATAAAGVNGTNVVGNAIANKVLSQGSLGGMPAPQQVAAMQGPAPSQSDPAAYTPVAAARQQVAQVMGPAGTSVPQNQPMPAMAATPPPMTGFIPTQGPSNENPAAKRERINSELAVYNASPATKQAMAAAEASGKDAGALPLEAANSQEITDRLRQNVQKLLANNDSTPDSSWVSPETKAYLSKRFGDGKDAGKVAEWNQIDQQQILSDYGQLVKSGAIKGSRQIFQALQTGSGIPVDEPRSARKDLLSNLLAEIENKNITTQNVNADINGGQQQPYKAIPTEGAPAVGGWSVKRVK